MVDGARPWRNLGSWAAARDLWRIAGRECFLKLPTQLAVKFSPFALFAGLIMLRHFATSVLGYLTDARSRNGDRGSTDAQQRQ